MIVGFFFRFWYCSCTTNNGWTLVWTHKQSLIGETWRSESYIDWISKFLADPSERARKAMIETRFFFSSIFQIYYTMSRERERKFKATSFVNSSFVHSAIRSWNPIQLLVCRIYKYDQAECKQLLINDVFFSFVES